jgi:4-hydroxybenzoate polyprenyltransferase
MRALRALVRLARPKQWVKNIFVFTALIFSRSAASSGFAMSAILNVTAIVDSLVAFACFCAASSAVYFFNDYRDCEEDRHHPVKRDRPLARGDLPRWVGLAGFVACAAGSLAASTLVLGTITAGVVGTYLVFNLAYSAGLKHVVIVDVLIIAAGFVLRILAGAAAISALPSTWLILCAITLSLFLGFTKRRAEVVLLKEHAHEHRRVLAHYDTGFLDQMISIVTAATVVCYVLYTVDARTVEIVGSRLLLFTVPFVLYGVFRYLYLVYHVETGGDPTRTVITDVPILLTSAGWAGTCVVVILFGRNIMSALY